MTAASVSARLKLAGLPPHVAELANDRLMMKRAFLSAGVATPWHAEIVTPQELQRAVIARGRDLVLKPVEQLGPAARTAPGRDGGSAPPRFQQVRAASPSERVMVELAKHPPPAGLPARRDLPYGGGGRYPRSWWSARRAALGISEGPVVAEILRQDAMPQLAELSPRLGRKG